MPTYEYVCDACEHEFDEFQSITAKPLKKCPSCAKPKLRRKIGTGAGVIFKGAGFYETDYRSEGYKKAEKAEKESSTASTGSDAKADTKPKTETKAESKPAKAEAKPAAKPKAKAKASDA